MGLQSLAVVALAVALGGCGRVGFDGLAQRGDGGGTSDLGGSAGPDAGLVPPGALVWLKMDDVPLGTNVVDSASNHVAGCGPCPTRVVGLHGDAYQFAMEEVTVNSTNNDLDVATGFTGALWVKLTATPTSLACPWTKPFNGGAGYDTFGLCIDTSGASVYDCETPTGTANSQNGPVLAPGVWHHLAMTWDGTTKRNYFDGTEVGAVALQIGHSAEALNLGAARSAYYTPGILDDALYYPRALSAAEIQQLATP